MYFTNIIENDELIVITFNTGTAHNVLWIWGVGGGWGQYIYVVSRKILKFIIFGIGRDI